MKIKENIILYKGFEINEKGHLFCRDYDFGHIDEIIRKTFTLDIDEKDLTLCETGFHACDCIGKTVLFYTVKDKNKFFKIFVKKAFYEDAEKFIFKSFTVKECIKIPQDNTGDCNTGDRNTGDCNTGDRNTGNRNTGNWNTGNRNTGNRNTGDWNTGDWNTGNCNTGYRNTGNCNTGHSNTGDRNTGHRNTGYRNTGNCNTGHRNTGDRNLTNYSSGFFAIEEPKAFCFGEPTKYTVSQFRKIFHNIIDSVPSFDNLMKLPNATEEKVNKYLEKFNKMR